MVNDLIKKFKSKKYNFLFNKTNGNFMRWGETLKDDPEMSPVGPEIMDIEVSTICHQGCPWCYKSNTANGKNMSLDDFKRMFVKFPKTLTQIAFGIGSIDANPELFDILRFVRSQGVIPNITINGSRMTKEYYDSLASLCGAVAVSLYDFDSTMNAVNELTSRGMKQVNIHALLSQESLEKCNKIIDLAKTDERLKGLNAIVFLWLKPKGNRNMNHALSNLNDFKSLVDKSLSNNVNIGFDSCSANNFLKAMKGHKDYAKFELNCEPCESTLFSYYINADGVGYPCSFCEGELPYKGVDVLNCNDFLRDVWFNSETVSFRMRNLGNCRSCSQFNLECEFK